MTFCIYDGVLYTEVTNTVRIYSDNKQFILNNFGKVSYTLRHLHMEGRCKVCACSDGFAKGRELTSGNTSSL
jgi:hypothetical protein